MATQPIAGQDIREKRRLSPTYDVSVLPRKARLK